jgi:hypothetical protein
MQGYAKYERTGCKYSINIHDLNQYEIMTDEEAFPGVHSLLSWDFAHLVDLSELCLPLKKFVLLTCFWRDIELLVNFFYSTLL